jgi:hypothetical protein
VLSYQIQRYEKGLREEGRNQLRAIKQAVLFGLTYCSLTPHSPAKLLNFTVFVSLHVRWLKSYIEPAQQAVGE